MADPEAEFHALVQVIAEHLPSEGAEYSDEDEADFIYLALRPGGDYEAWDADAELRRLKDLRRAARALAFIYKELHPTVRTTMELASIDMQTKGRLGHFKHPGIQVIGDLPEMIERSCRAGEFRIQRGRPAGRTDWEAVSIVGCCRIVWERRSQRPAPTALNPASKFGKFVQAVFDALEIDRSPQAMMAAWKRVEN